MGEQNMVKRRSWEDFRSNGLLWLINSILHIFGWAICFEYNDEDPTELLEVYPARVKYRGFSEECNDRGYKNISRYMKYNSANLYEECE